MMTGEVEGPSQIRYDIKITLYRDRNGDVVSATVAVILNYMGVGKCSTRS